VFIMALLIRRATTIAMLCASLPLAADAQTLKDRYLALQQREAEVIAALEAAPTDIAASDRDQFLKYARAVIASYDAFVRRNHGSGYADNALFNAATIAQALADKFNRAADRAAAERYFARLKTEYPSSSLLKAANVKPASQPVSAEPTRATATLTSIDRTVMPEAIRITLALDREVAYREERLAGPERVFFDLKGVQAIPELRDVVLRYADDAVRQIRVGRHPAATVRVVLDLEGVTKYSVFTLYNPFRVIVDCETRTRTAAVAAPRPAKVIVTEPAPSSPAVTLITAAPTVAVEPVAAVAPIAPTSPRLADPAPRSGQGPRLDDPAPRPGQGPRLDDSTPRSGQPDGTAPVAPVAPEYRTAPVAPLAPTAPAAPSSNTAGGFSLSLQLGLGVTRIVIDPGHGGHDPGAQGKSLNEADLTLDVALRLETLLQREGFDVVLTRRTNVYVPLEERTAIANRENADLFLSIHANASRNEAARGVETYFLSFATSPDAEAVAARENSGSAGGMHNLPDIIKAIALNNKLDESRDLAGMVQEALVSRLRRSNKDLRSLGVKKAPFVVLIGASMPSVLAEISFLTNKQELQLLKTNSYKQRIAEALHAAVMRYRRSLKGRGQVAEQ
jgi:N-acetylmuramoyl-L-alanine amidase